jgi:hypothetical protein
VDVTWNRKNVMMFTQDLRSRAKRPPKIQSSPSPHTT